MQTSHVVRVQEESQVGGARRAAISFAEGAGLGNELVNRVALVATEMATNLVKHTGKLGGEILLQLMANTGQGGIELLALDNGPGIHSVSLALEDGFSTRGTAGGGLGGTKRMATYFDIFSRPGLGTAILAQFEKVPVNEKAWQVGAVCLPLQTEELNGDQWDYYSAKDGDAVFITSDGLGHGPRAYEASLEAVRIFEEDGGRPLPVLFENLHGGLRKTRGAAISAMTLSPSARKIRFMGVGNVTGAVITPEKSTQMAALSGIVGHEVRKLQEFEYAFPEGSIVLMHSDGLSAKWDFQKYPGLLRRHPTLIAGVLYRDFRREKDDVTVVVAREGAR